MRALRNKSRLPTNWGLSGLISNPTIILPTVSNKRHTSGVKEAAMELIGNIPSIVPLGFPGRILSTLNLLGIFCIWSSGQNDKLSHLKPKLRSYVPMLDRLSGTILVTGSIVGIISGDIGFTLPGLFLAHTCLAIMEKPDSPFKYLFAFSASGSLMASCLIPSLLCM